MKTKYSNEQICQAIQKWLGILQQQIAADNKVDNFANEAISFSDIKSIVKFNINKLRRKLFSNGFGGDISWTQPDSDISKIASSFGKKISTLLLDIDLGAKVTEHQLEIWLDRKAKLYSFAYKILTMQSKYSGCPVVQFVSYEDNLRKFVRRDYAHGDNEALIEINSHIKPFNPDKDYSEEDI